MSDRSVMGTIVLHAGMGKAGSSSIQTWLGRNAARLRERDVVLLVPRPAGEDADSPLDLREYRSGGLVANALVFSYRSGGGEAILDRFAEQLDATASRHRMVVVSGEALEQLVWSLNEGFLDRLERLARSHRLRVAYYVRPQHTALEAHWRQWGFRSGMSPSEFISSRTGALHYADTYRSVRERAPGVSFEPRPFRRDLLDRGDPAQDFAGRFLGPEEADVDAATVWSNPGLPLEVVNALRYAPEGLLWESIRDNRGLNTVKRIVAHVEAEETDEIRRSRRLLQAYAHRVFEPGNSVLVRELGWEADSFVPPAEEAGDEPERLLALIDELWEPSASRTELALLYAAIADAAARRTERRARREAGGRREGGPAGKRRRATSRGSPPPPGGTQEARLNADGSPRGLGPRGAGGPPRRLHRVLRRWRRRLARGRRRTA